MENKKTTEIAMSKEKIDRYSRQLMIPEIGLQGQKKLSDAQVLVVGAGGLGCPALLYLAAAGIGTLGIVDFDEVDISNLPRQIVFSENDIGKNKVECAATRLFSINSSVKIDKISTSISIDNALDIIESYDVIIDASDNFLTRYIINDACQIKSKPLVSGSVFRFEGQVSVFNVNDYSPCYRCLYASPPPKIMVPNCSEGGTLGAVAGVIGSIQANECIKIILENDCTLSGKMMGLNLLDLDFSLLEVKKSSSCICASNKKNKNLNPAWYKFDELNQLCTKIKTISSKDVLNSLKNANHQMVFINVKESWEKDGIVAKLNEISIPLSTIENDIESIIDKISHQGKNIFYCEDGFRSEKAISLIEKEYGHTNLYNFNGNPHKLFN